MDAATLRFHREVLRHAKGLLKSYTRWLDEQADTATLESLKRRRATLAQEIDEALAMPRDT